MPLLAAEKDNGFEATMNYDGRITIGKKSYSFKKGETFTVSSEKHLKVIEAEKARRNALLGE